MSTADELTGTVRRLLETIDAADSQTGRPASVHAPLRLTLHPDHAAAFRQARSLPAHAQTIVREHLAGRLLAPYLHQAMLEWAPRWHELGLREMYAQHLVHGRVGDGDRLRTLVHIARKPLRKRRPGSRIRPVCGAKLRHPERRQRFALNQAQPALRGAWSMLAVCPQCASAAGRYPETLETIDALYGDDLDREMVAHDAARRFAADPPEVGDETPAGPGGRLERKERLLLLEAARRSLGPQFGTFEGAVSRRLADCARHAHARAMLECIHAHGDQALDTVLGADEQDLLRTRLPAGTARLVDLLGTGSLLAADGMSRIVGDTRFSECLARELRGSLAQPDTLTRCGMRNRAGSRLRALNRG